MTEDGARYERKDEVLKGEGEEQRRRRRWQQRRRTQEMRGMVRCLSSERRKVFTVDQHSKSWGEVAVSARDEVKNTPRFE